jgi:hypothetical protein
MTAAATGVFSPIRVGTMSLGHRLVVPPHSGGGGALLGTEEQFERMCRYWLARVQGGTEVAALAAELGHRVTMLEREGRIGRQLAVAALARSNRQYADWLACGSVSNDSLYHELRHRHPAVHALGDAYAPRRLSFATRQARELVRAVLT